MIAISKRVFAVYMLIAASMPVLAYLAATTGHWAAWALIFAIAWGSFLYSIYETVKDMRKEPEGPAATD